MKFKQFFKIELMSINFLLLGFFFINFSFLENDTRRLLSFSLFGIAILLSLKNNINYAIRSKLTINHVLGVIIILYAVFFTYIYGAHGEYGKNKYYYFLFIIALSFIFLPPLFNKNENIKQFVLFLVAISVVYCFISIFFSITDGSSRRGESGLNPALLARICMISGIYGLAIIHFKGITIFRLSLVIVSCLAVLITGTKTPIPVAILSYLLVTTNKISLLLLVKIVINITVILLASYLALTYIVPESISSRVLNLGAFTVAEQSTEGNRLDLYKLAILIVSDNYTGVGFGGFTLFHGFVVVPHNIFLENAIEMGIMSVILFILWSIYIAYLTKKNKSNNLYFIFIKILFIYMLISLMFGGETTIQSFLLYLTGSIIILLRNKMDTH